MLKVNARGQCRLWKCRYWLCRARMCISCVTQRGTS